ncbi:MAG: DUF5011 domain-containing protein [Campylobacterota bacterium]|nr:DUF5011 domain-containing protein [Campylobacterota bacterium]
MKNLVVALTLIINIAWGGAFTLSQDQEEHLDSTLRGMMSVEDTTLQGNREHAQRLLEATEAIKGGWENSKFKYSYKMLITESERIAIFIILEVRNPYSKVVKMFDMQEGFILFGDAMREVGEQLIWYGYLEDTTAPTITLNGSSSLSITRGSTYTELGATVIDDFDGNLSVTISGSVNTSSSGTYRLTYSAIDSSGNEANVTRSVRVYTPYSPPAATPTPTPSPTPIPDTTAPVITITGDNPMSIEVGGSYSESGATAMDNVDGAITATPSGSVDANTAGTYTITYNATDSSGNSAEANRTVNVIQVKPLLANTTLSVDENATSGTVVGSVTVDNEGNSSITNFELNDTTTFEINASGSIKTKTTLSYATQNSYTLEANATNGAGTSANVTVTINLNDTIPPVITIIGDNPISIELDGSYSEEGASAMDNADGNITHLINTSGSVDTATAGDYNITYSVSDNAGNEASAIRTVTVVAFVKLKKTGQTIKYVDYDDGYYQKGQEHNYTRDDTKEIVTDNVTGLMWQDDSEAKTVTKQWVTQANYDAGNYNDTSGDTATTYCTNLSLGGHTDWRLPTSTELEGIVDYGKSSPSINGVFINTSSRNYWSSTTRVDRTGNAWRVFFSIGTVGNRNKDYSDYVRCVRAGE